MGVQQMFVWRPNFSSRILNFLKGANGLAFPNGTKSFGRRKLLSPMPGDHKVNNDRCISIDLSVNRVAVIRRYLLAILFGGWWLTYCVLAGDDLLQSHAESESACNAPSCDLENPVPGKKRWRRVHTFTGLPMTEDGWTDLTTLYQHPDLYQDSRIVYVSSSEGDDSSGIVYQPGDPEIGNDPFSVLDGVTPFATLAAAYSQLRSGYPDILLLKRGDVWSEGLPEWDKSGRSSFEPIIISSYGDAEVTNRPVIESFNTRYGPSQPSGVFHDLLIVGVEFTGMLRRVIGGSSWLIEDCGSIDGRSSGFNIQGLGEAPLEKVAIRRCVVAGRYRDDTSGHVQGIYVGETHDLLIEECILDHNGLNLDGTGATIYNHNAYLNTSNSNVVFRSNISARASSHGVHQRSGGLMEENLFLQNPLVQFGYSHSGAELYGPFSGIIRNNVTLDSRNIGNSVRGFGLRLETLRSAAVYGNIIAHQRTGTANILGISLGHFSNYLQHAENISISGNIVYKWERQGIGTSLLFEQPTSTQIRNIVVSFNLFQQSDASLISIPTAAANEFSIFGNQYYSARSQSFIPGGTFEQWQLQVNDIGSTFLKSKLPDPERDIQSYMASIGHTFDNYQESLEAFLLLARLQRRGNWSPELTADAVCQYIRAGFGMPAKGLAN